LRRVITGIHLPAPRWVHRLIAVLLVPVACLMTTGFVMALVRGRALELKFGFLPTGLWMALWSVLVWWSAIATWRGGDAEREPSL
jgi:hypothetical protein